MYLLIMRGMFRWVLLRRFREFLSWFYFSLLRVEEGCRPGQLIASFNTNFFGHGRSLSIPSLCPFTDALLTVFLTQALLPHFRARKSGTIAFIGSVAGLLAFPCCSAYSATKYAIAGTSFLPFLE